MMSQRTDALLAWPTIEFLLQVNGAREVRFGPLDVRGPENREDRTIERGSKMARAAVGRDQQISTANACLGQSQRQGMIVQTPDMRMIRTGDNVPALLAL